MDYTKLGNTGMDVSRICLGCMGFGDAERWVHKWVLDEENSRPIIQKALELGINFFDTANVYSIGRSEEILGRALRDLGRTGCGLGQIRAAVRLRLILDGSTALDP